MLRTELLKRNINNKKDLYFQIIDWSSNDIYKSINKNNDDDEESEENNKYKKKRRLVLRGYGVTKEGYSISIHIFNFKPYFYIKIPQDWNDRIFRNFKNECLSQIPEYNHEGLDECKIVDRKDFYGFNNNKLFKYALFKFKNQSSYYGFLKLFREKKINMKRLNQEFDFSKKIYETKVNSLIRFFHNNNIDPSGWLKISKGAYILNTPKLSRCQFDVSIDCQQVLKADLKMTPKIVVASFDIECTSCDGAFPKFSRPEDRIIQIGTTVYIYGENECALKYICTLKKCDPIDDVMLECYETERDLLIGWAKFIERLDPDIMTGYNIWGFDWEYIYERIKMENCTNQVFRYLNRLKNKDEIKQELTVQDLSSSALGQNILKYINIEGIIQIDLLKVVQRDHKLDSYKLDNVSKVFMNNQKEDLSPKQLFDNYKDGSSDKIKEIAVYCVKDCILVNELINKLQVITNNMGMSNVCIVPFSYLFTRGQGIKIFSLVAKFCNDENFIIKDLNMDDIDKSSYEGAIVFVPEPGVYFEPVVVMDYNSLYPSSMIAENISHDSLLGFKEYRLKDKKSKNDKDEYELLHDTIQHEYEDLEGYHYIDIEYDVFQGVDDDKKKVGYKTCRFAEPDNGDKSVLPRILRKLLKARKDTRKVMKYKTVILKDGETYSGLLEEKDDIYEVNNLELGVKTFKKEDVEKTKKTNNDFQIAVLDGLQLAYKVTCNSLYGQVGATTSPICCKELAACTTATGRRMVIVARDLTLEKFEGSKLTYGDTDSVFINFTDTIKKRNPGKELTEKELLAGSIEIGEEAAAHINSHMKAPQNIEYEKTFWPFCIFSKKRYFGNKYEFDLDKYKQTSMGIVLKRRDNAPIVKTIYGGVIDIILNKRNVEDSKKYFKSAIKDLLDGNVDISQLVISKTVKTDYANPTQIAHKVLADRMGERDPGNKPQSNDRIPYCYIETSNLKCKICNSKVNPDKCKCTTCMGVFCYYHLGNHTAQCKKICRFCRVEEGLERCGTCTGYYCKKCFKKHQLRTDKYKVQHNDKCKKILPTKLLQGDTIEHPQYITENKLKIDYNYYLTNQIEKPVFQIFELVMKNPEKIIEDLVREQKNKKNGNASIKQWFTAMNKNNESNKSENIQTQLLKNKVDYNQGDDDDNLLDVFEEEEEDKDNLILE